MVREKGVMDSEGIRGEAANIGQSTKGNAVNG
jgi:hypothetical protein